MREAEVAEAFIREGISMYKPDAERKHIMSGVDKILEMYQMAMEDPFSTDEDIAETETAVFYIAKGIGRGAELAGDHVTAEMIYKKIDGVFGLRV